MSAPAFTSPATPRVHVAHVVHRFDYGGLENGLVNLVNRLPHDRYVHTIIAMTEATEFRSRIRRADVQVHALAKRPGQDPGAYWRLVRLLRRLRPDVLHTRNYGTLDCQVAGAAAGVPARIHGEHGWDVTDPDGTRRKYQWARRALSPLIDRFVALSADLERWLTGPCRVAPGKVVRICNGVDTDRFAPRAGARRLLPADARPPGSVVVGTVTRCSEIKDPLNVVRAFVELRRRCADGPDVRLALVGDGPLRAAAVEMLREAGLLSSAWLPGSRDDVAELVREFDVFVLGSRREGISNTVLEAMASGLPVVATATGGNVELVSPGRTGALVPVGDSQALADALWTLVTDADLRRSQGEHARAASLQQFSIEAMLGSYDRLYADVARNQRRSH